MAGVALEASLSPMSGWPTACATISCDYCKAVLSFQGLPAVRWLLVITFWFHLLFAGTQTTLPRSIGFFSTRSHGAVLFDVIDYVFCAKDDVIRRSISKQLPGLLPPLPAEEEEQGNNSRKPFVKMERKPNLMLKYSPDKEDKVAMESSSTQTELVMAEIEAMVLNNKKQLQTLEVAVQTIELEGGGFRVRESEMEKKLDSQHSAER